MSCGPVDGVEEALDRIDIPICVASSGTHAKIRFSLGVTGLTARFDGRIFSVEDVERGKPAPDLFLLRGRTDGSGSFGVRRRRRQRVGGDGGIAAGMCVFAYAGGVTPASQLALDGAHVFDEMAELPDLL